jgi:hypothetical protein
VASLEARKTQEATLVRLALGIPASGVCLLVLGNIKEWKGQHIVIRAMKLLKDKKEALDKLEIDKVKRLYELIKISTIKQTPAEQDELLGIIKLIYT